jgi:hypothetical protein
MDEEQEVILTDAPDWILGQPAIYHPKSNCVQVRAIAPNGWYSAHDMTWRLRTDTDPMYTCMRCFKQTHLLCKNTGRCRDCAKLFA